MSTSIPMPRLMTLVDAVEPRLTPADLAALQQHFEVQLDRQIPVGALEAAWMASQRSSAPAAAAPRRTASTGAVRKTGQNPLILVAMAAMLVFIACAAFLVLTPSDQVTVPPAAPIAAP